MTPEQIAKTGKESSHQKALFCWCQQNKATYPVLASKLFFAIKNEEKSNSVIAGAGFKASGVKAGVSDMFLALPRQGYAGLFLELKTQTGKVSSEQKEFISLAIASGYAAEVAYGWEDARDKLISYLS